MAENRTKTERGEMDIPMNIGGKKGTATLRVVSETPKEEPKPPQTKKGQS